MRIIVVAAAVAVLAAGCGSRANFATVPGDAAAAQGDSGSGPASSSSSGSPSSSSPSTGAGPTASSAAGPASALSSTLSPAGSSLSDTGPSGPGSPHGHGGAPIRVGYVISDTAGVAAVTGSNVGASDAAERKEMEALLTYANSQGGVGGRQLIGVPITISATSQQSERLADCKSMTEDSHDQVVIDQNLFLVEEDWSCFAQHHVDYLGNVTGTDRNFLSSVAPYVTTTYLALDRQMAATADGATAAGFFKGGKVGVILPDTPTGHRDYASILGPRLAADGVPSPDVRYITLDNGGTQQAQTNSAELDFASKGVNRVVFFHDIVVYLAFTNQAQSQGYHPEYAFPDFEGAAGIAAFYGNSQQNANAIAISSYIVNDDNSHKSTDTSTPVDRNKASPGQRRCLDVLSKETHSDYYSPTASGASNLEVYYCDEFFTWWDAARLDGAGWTPTNWAAGLKALGSTEQSPLQHTTDFSSGHNDGASSYRVGRFDATCTCFVKITAWLPIAT